MFQFCDKVINFKSHVKNCNLFLLNTFITVSTVYLFITMSLRHSYLCETV